MELRHLEYFLAACEYGSLNRAAEALIMSQANVSKIISSLEKELGYVLFERTNKGLKITQKGKQVQEYARHVLKNVEIIQGLDQRAISRTLTISSYQSNMMAHVLVDMYREDSDLIIKYQEGSVEEITDHVRHGDAEIGLLYVSQKQLRAFRHIISHKKLEFVPLATKEACIYLGPYHPLYREESIDASQLPNLRFVRGTHDFFSMEHHLQQVSVGVIGTEQLNHFIYTNSDHLTIDLLLHTDICSLGIDLMCKKYEEYPIKSLKIRQSEPFLVIGYVYQEEHILSAVAQTFINRFKELL